MPFDLHGQSSEKRSLARDFLAGQAGFWPRAAISVCSGGVILALVLVAMGIIENMGSTRRLDDESAAAALGAGGLVWIGLLVYIWWSYGRFGPLLRMGLYILGVWVIAIPLCFFVDRATMREELMICGIVVAGIAITLGLVFSTTYRISRGQPVISTEGNVNVNCPDCGYSMVGKHDCTCPECGCACTIDELIRRQNYEVVGPTLKQDASDSRHPLTAKQPNVAQPVQGSSPAVG
ncbi:MAG: hypothetical protein ACR2GY_11075 [Phycisphaerales bacterium]